MKRILTLALAAILVVAFAIPTFAAPKIELVGGTVKTTYSWGAGNTGTQDNIPVFGALKFKLSADNFVFNITTAWNAPTVWPGAAETFTTPTLAIKDYSFSLALPYMTLSGMYGSWLETYSYHWGRELKLASDAKFKELTGFEWAVYMNDDEASGMFLSQHASVTVPVGEAFTGTLLYTHDATAGHMGTLGVHYDVAENLFVDVSVAKNITSATNDFHFFAGVGFPIVEGFTGTVAAQYGMTGFTTDGDHKIKLWYDNLWAGDTFDGVIDVRYNNENANGQIMAYYASAADFTTGGYIGFYGEYVSNGSLSYDVTNRPNYGWTTDSRNRGWNTYFDWVRNNNGNEFAVGADAFYYVADQVSGGIVTAPAGSFDVTGKAMFAPDVVPVVISLKAYVDNYSGAAFGDIWYSVENWIGVRINPDIHFALYNYYDIDNGFDMDAALVYKKDSVTAKVTGTSLVTGAGAELYLGISF